VRKRRVVYALLLAPISTPIVFFLLGLPQNKNDSLREMFSAFLVLIMFTLPPAYLAELVLGLPIWLAFRRFRISSRLAFACGGCLIGFAIGLLLSKPYEFAIAGLVPAMIFREIITEPSTGQF
jgi:hypothetical protein